MSEDPRLSHLENSNLKQSTLSPLPQTPKLPNKKLELSKFYQGSQTQKFTYQVSQLRSRKSGTTENDILIPNENERTFEESQEELVKIRFQYEKLNARFINQENEISRFQSEILQMRNKIEMRNFVYDTQDTKNTPTNSSPPKPGNLLKERVGEKLKKKLAHPHILKKNQFSINFPWNYKKKKNNCY